MRLNHEPMGSHFDKWHVEGLPRSAVFHRFTAADLGDPHDHPWGFHSFVVSGGYVEEVFEVDGSSRFVLRSPGESFYVPAAHIHRLVELIGGECWTIILPGQPERDSGFYQFRDGQAYHRPWHRADFQPLQVDG